MKINYSGLHRAERRERKRNKRKYGMVVSGSSVKLLDKIIKEKNEQSNS